MKKAKIMLTAITVLAVVGGALAFKASKFNDLKFCISTIDYANGGTCPALAQDLTFDNVSPTVGYVTTDASATSCPSNILCTSIGRSIAED